jgi:hypothetical protein
MKVARRRWATTLNDGRNRRLTSFRLATTFNDGGCGRHNTRLPHSGVIGCGRHNTRLPHSGVIYRLVIRVTWSDAGGQAPVGTHAQ